MSADIPSDCAKRPLGITIAQALAQASLPQSDSPKLDTEILLSHALGVSRTYLYTWPEKTLSAQQLTQFEHFLARREKGEPIAYITGEQEFWSLALKVSPATLIPRADTETLVETALEFIQKCQPSTAINVLDLGCGTGAIGLAIASECKHAQILGVDVVSNAVELARENAAHLNIANATFLQSNWFEALSPETHRFDLIVSNPPYIDERDIHLAQGDVRYEPKSALVAANHGLADIHAIASHACEYLKEGGLLAFEHGWQQAAEVHKILKQLHYRRGLTIKDLAGNERVTTAFGA